MKATLHDTEHCHIQEHDGRSDGMQNTVFSPCSAWASPYQSRTYLHPQAIQQTCCLTHTYSQDAHAGIESCTKVWHVVQVNHLRADSSIACCKQVSDNMPYEPGAWTTCSYCPHFFCNTPVQHIIHPADSPKNSYVAFVHRCSSRLPTRYRNDLMPHAAAVLTVAACRQVPPTHCSTLQTLSEAALCRLISPQYPELSAYEPSRKPNRVYTSAVMTHGCSCHHRRDWCSTAGEYPTIHKHNTRCNTPQQGF
jgi:hypothetical protein